MQQFGATSYAIVPSAAVLVVCFTNVSLLGMHHLKVTSAPTSTHHQAASLAPASSHGLAPSSPAAVPCFRALLALGCGPPSLPSQAPLLRSKYPCRCVVEGISHTHVGCALSVNMNSHNETLPMLRCFADTDHTAIMRRWR